MSKANIISLTRIVKRRLIETFSSFRKRRENLTLINSGSTYDIHSEKSCHKFKVDKEWFKVHLERFDLFRDLEAPVLEECIFGDCEPALETAAKVVLTLWGSLESHFGLKFEENLDDIVRSVMMYVPMCGEEQPFIAFLKFQLSWLFAKAEKQKEMPEGSAGIHNKGFVLVGWLGRFFRSRTFGKKLINKEWRNTVLHGIKKGLPKMGLVLLEKNMKSMKERLCPEVPRVTPDGLLDEITRTTREIFPQGIIFEDWQGVDLYTSVSDHSSYENSRAKRGVMGSLIQETGLELPAIEADCLGAMVYNPMRDTVQDLRIPSLSLQVMDEYKSEQNRSIFNYEQGCAKVKPVFEPNKIRAITAGDLKSNGVYSNLQKVLWKGLQRYEQFALTGRPVIISDIEKIDVKSSAEFTDFVSGDYSAATDNLNRDASLECIRALCGDPITLHVLQKGLMDTWLDYDGCGAKGIEGAKMTNGQLMGCVFSFPILCIINLACYRKSLEEYYGHSIPIEDLPVLVNGDDILFKSNNRLFGIWERNIKGVGFTKSVGKNYVSPDFCVINSVYFDTTNLDRISKVPYLNMGIITGEKKHGLESLGEKPKDDVWSIKAQVAKTRSDWNTDPDVSSILGKLTYSRKEYFNRADVNGKHQQRRQEVIDRFVKNLRLSRLESILESGYSMATCDYGLDLDDSNFSGLEGNSIPEEVLCTIYQDMKRTKKPFSGLKKLPKSSVPWKVHNCATIEEDEAPDQSEMRKLRKKFFEGKLKRGADRMDRKLSQMYVENIFKNVEREKEERLLVCGELLR